MILTSYSNYFHNSRLGRYPSNNFQNNHFLVRENLVFLIPIHLRAFFLPRFRKTCKKETRRVISRGCGLILGTQPWIPYNAKIEVPQDRPVLLVANHQSTLDIFMILAKVRQLRILAKAPLFRIPLLGYGMRKSQQIPVIRNDPTSYLKAMEEVRKALAEGDTVLVFPEGTRSDPDHQGTLEFQLAPFSAALKEEALVVPVVIRGSGKVWPKGRFGILPFSPISLRSLPAIDSKDYGESKKLRNEVHTRINQALREK